MEKRVFQCHKIPEGIVEGEAVVSKDDIVSYLTDPKTDTAIEPGHDLEGKSIAKKILIFPSGKGNSVVQTDGTYQFSTKGNTPKAVIIRHLGTVPVSSVIIMEVPMVDKVDPVFYDVIKDGDITRVDIDHSVTEILPGQSTQTGSHHCMKEENENESSITLVYQWGVEGL